MANCGAGLRNPVPQGVYNQFNDEEKKIFEQAYAASFGPAMDICYEIYEVCAGGGLLISVKGRGLMEEQEPGLVQCGEAYVSFCTKEGHLLCAPPHSPGCHAMPSRPHLLAMALRLTNESPVLQDVACGNEIRSVVNAVSRFDRWPMGKIDQTHMWQVRAVIRKVDRKIKG